MWLAHIYDTVRYLRIENAQESTADYPLFIKFCKTRDFHGRARKKEYPHGFREVDSGCCAYASMNDEDDSTLIELQIPIPAYCPYDLQNSVIMLINHEIMHIILEDVLEDSEGYEGLEASDLWDHPKTTKRMNKILPDTYCHCGTKPLNPIQTAI